MRSMYKDSYKVLLFSFLLCCRVFCIWADSAAVEGNDRGAPAASAEADITLKQDETSLMVGDVAAPRSAEKSTASVLFQLVLSLAVVCVLVYGVLCFIRRSKQFTAADDPFLKNVASLAIAPNKTVCIVTLIDKAYMIGVSDASLSLLAEISDKELIDAMNLHAAQAAGPKQSFSSFLHTFFPASKPKHTEGNPFDSFLAQQRSRLKNSGSMAETGNKHSQNKRDGYFNAENAAARSAPDGETQYNTVTDGVKRNTENSTTAYTGMREDE